MSFCRSMPKQIPAGTFGCRIDRMRGVEFVHANRALGDILHVSSDNMSALSRLFPSIVHPEDRAFFTGLLKNAALSLQPMMWEGRLVVAREVKSVWLDLTPPPSSDLNGSWIGVLQDRTDVNNMWERLESLLETAQYPDQVNGDWLNAERAKARLEERERILKDIHDGFGNQLAIGKLRLHRGAVPVDKAVEIIDDCLGDLRLLIDSLDAEGDSLWSVLSVLSERLDARTRSLPITLEWDIDAAGDIHLPPRIMLQAARIVQEAVSNALRHAGASVISTAVRVESGRPIIEVKDDGKGFDLAQVFTGRGLNNMRARAEQQGWQLEVASDSSGTSITLDLGQA